jgi:heterodisulfide reductase subunit D
MADHNPETKNRFTTGDRFQMTACTGCMACTENCPAVLAAMDGRVSPTYRLKETRRILNSRVGGLLGRIFGTGIMSEDARRRFSETVFRCTLCGRCKEICPVGIRLKDLWIRLRADLVDGGVYPDKIDRIRKNLVQTHNVFGEENEDRLEWVEDLADPPSDLFVRDQADAVYFTGCTAAFFPVAQKIPAAVSEVLTAAGIRFTLLGDAEWCCGFPLLGAGIPDTVNEFAEHNIEAVLATGAKTVIFACPSCYDMWNRYYPYREAGISPVHETKFIRDLLLAGKLPLKTMNHTVTYHDPCDLGRGAGEYDAPREILRALPGVRFVEMERVREESACCGGGGNLEMIDAPLAAEIARSRIEEARRTGADTIVTACQQCVRAMMTFVRRNKVDIRVADIAELVRMFINTKDTA